jgi:TfoX/Sxy family transcriptional regulator of competence genes
MAYDEGLAERIRGYLSDRNDVVEKKMMGGLTFMVDGKMCVGVVKNDLMVRFDPERQEEIMSKSGARVMDFTGKSMIGFALVETETLREEGGLARWLDIALSYNRIAKPSKKRR